MKPSQRFVRLAQLLFTHEVSEEEHNTAKQIVDLLDKTIDEFAAWEESLEKNLEVFNNYHGSENALVIISEKFDNTINKQKERYEHIVKMIKDVIGLVGEIEDVEMQEMVGNITSTSEKYTELYNEMADMGLKPGEPGFIQKFKDLSQKLIDGNAPFFDVLEGIRDYVMTNVLGEQSLT